jgi:hypothetical protein
MTRLVLGIVAGMTAGAALATTGAAKFTAAEVKKDVPGELEPAVARLLTGPVLEVRAESGDPVLTFWFRGEIPGSANEEQVKNGLTYREVPTGTVVGAVKLHAAFKDYRRQELPAGVYTLRLAVQPTSDDHSGTAPHTEFLLLSPASEDKDEKPVEGKALYELSAKSTGGKHPGVMLLYPNNAKDAKPRVTDKGGGVFVRDAALTVDSGGTATKLGFSVTVAGHTKE